MRCSTSQKRKEVEDDGESDHSTGIMEDSGLTEEERRQIRKEQRQLLKELDEKDTIELDEARERNNRIYKKVRYAREAVLDGENLISIANKASQKVDRLIQVPRYDADRLVLKLVEKVRKETNGGTGYQFDWEVLGEAAGACFNAVPADVAFLNGPLAHGQGPVLRRAPIRRRVIQEDREAVAQRPEDVEGHTEKDENKLSAIEESMKAMSKILEKKVNQQYRSNKEKLQQAYGGDIPADVAKKVKKFGTDIDGCQFLVNPKSFTQTVENIFHYSFLVKKGAASIALRDKALDLSGVTTKPGLAIKYVTERPSPPPAKQAIMTLTMQDWRDLCATYQVDAGDLPHRRINQDAYAASLSQAH